MWYSMTKYSFDPEKVVFGPFSTEEEAWDYIEKQADEELRIDMEENGWKTEIIKNKTGGEIVIKNFFVSGIDITEFFIFEIN